MGRGPSEKGRGHTRWWTLNELIEWTWTTYGGRARTETRVVCLLPDQNARNLEGLSVGWRGVIEARNDGWYWFVPDGDDDPVKLETGHAHLDWESNHPSDDPD